MQQELSEKNNKLAQKHYCNVFVRAFKLDNKDKKADPKVLKVKFRRDWKKLDLEMHFDWFEDYYNTLFGPYLQHREEILSYFIYNFKENCM